MQAYRIVDWDIHFENNRTRDMKALLWVPVPIKHDGYGYCILTETNGTARLGAWLAILQTAAKSHPRGTLLRDGRHPHTAMSIAVKTRLDKSIIQETLDVCITQEVGWIELVDIDGDMITPIPIPRPHAEIPHPPAGKGREEKGRKGKERKGRKIEKVTLSVRYEDLFGLDGFKDEWDNFLESRRTLKTSSTDRAHVLLLNELKARPSDAVAGMQMAIKRSWKGFDWDWYDNAKEKNGARNGSQNRSSERRAEKAGREFPEDIKPGLL